MAYTLRYFYEQKHEDGKVIRLEIYKRNATAAAMEIGDVVQGLSLNIEGGEDNIDTPVVTSSLVMTFVDAYDHPESYTKKCGNWAEFYTPDATLWKIIVKAKDPDSSFRTIWGGYVTPDSYEESLVYGGSVTITARDNIGHMSDFPFDAEGDSYGTISLRELIESAWAKIESPMELAWGSTWLECEGVSAPDTRMNVAAFAEKNWREAVEMALYGYGAVLRYIGENKVIICPLEGIPSFGTNEVERTEPIFMAGATRMLSPALKRIEESASYDLVSDLQPLVKQEDFSGNSHILDSDDNIRGFSLSNTQEGKGWLNTLDYTAIYFDASNYAISGVDASERNEIKKQMYVVANRPFSEFTEYSRYMSAQNVTIKVQFGTGLMRNVRENYLTPKAGKITSVCCRVSVTQNGITQYYDVSREWKTTSVYQTIAEEAGLTEINVPVDMSEYSGEVLIKVELGGIDATIPFVQIQSFSFETFGEDTYLATNRVNTNYDENNNVIITRDPAIAPAYNKTFLPSVIKNGIYVQSGCTYLPASAWSWKGQSAQQMAVFNHLQLICYYAKPNNILEGNIVNADVTRFAQIWDWEGKEHILVAGRFNFLSGYIEGAILREFARYDSMWGSIPSTQLPATEQTSVSNIEAAAQGGSSSNASTYTNNTTVNIGTGGGGSGASSLGELSDVDTTASVAGSVLFFNGSEWVDKSMQLILTELKQLGDFFYKTEDGLSIGTRFNFFSEKEISANGLNSGSGGSGAGLVSAVLGATSLGTTLANDNSVVFNAYATNEVYKVTQSNASRIGVLESEVGRLETSIGDGKFLPLTGGKLNLSGANSLSVNRNTSSNNPTVIRFESNGAFLGRFGFDASQRFVAQVDGAEDYKVLIHSGNIGDYALPLSGGTITTGTINSFVIKRSSNNAAAIRYENAEKLLGYIGIDDASNPSYYDVALNQYTLLHSGNIGDYTTGAANKLATARTIWGQSFDGTRNVRGHLTLGNDGILGGASSVNMLIYDSSNTLYLGYGMNGVGGTVLCGNALAMRYGESRTMGFLLNSSGNVTIGASDLAGTDAKLFVDGVARIQRQGDTRSYYSIEVGDVRVNHIGYDTDGFCSHAFYSNDELSFFIDGTKKIFTYSDLKVNGNTHITGNVGIGITAPQAKLHVDGGANISGTVYIGSEEHAILFFQRKSYHAYIIGASTLAISTNGDLDNIAVAFQKSKASAFFGAVTMDSTLSVSGKTTISNDLVVSGNVGIGTTNPEYKLHVNGNTFISGFTIAAKFFTKENYGLWKGNSYSASLADTDIALVGTKVAAYGAVTMSSTLSVTGDSTFEGNITCKQIRFGSSTGLRYTSKSDGAASANGINWYKDNFGTQIGTLGMYVEGNAAKYAYIGTNYQNTWFKTSPTESYIQTKLLIGQNDNGSGAKLQVNGGAFISGALSVTSTSTFTGATTHNGGIVSASISNSGNITIAPSASGGKVLLNTTNYGLTCTGGALSVGYIGELSGYKFCVRSGNAYIEGNTVVTGSLTIGSHTIESTSEGLKINGNLFATGEISANKLNA